MKTMYFGPKMGEVTGGSRKLCNEGLHNFKSLLNVLRMIKLGRIRWADYVARMGEVRNTPA